MHFTHGDVISLIDNQRVRDYFDLVHREIPDYGVVDHVTGRVVYARWYSADLRFLGLYAVWYEYVKLSPLALAPPQEEEV